VRILVSRPFLFYALYLRSRRHRGDRKGFYSRPERAEGVETVGTLMNNNLRKTAEYLRFFWPRKVYPFINKIFFPALAIFLLISIPASAQDYGIDVPYQRAVPAFINAVTNAVKDVPNKEEIAGWNDDIRERLPEFLDDAVKAMAAQVDKPLEELDIQEIEDFVAKWQGVLATCPNCVDLAPLVEPLVEELLRGLPPPPKGDVPPFPKVFDYYQQLERLNPWGLAALFQFEWLSPQIHQVNIVEHSKEITRQGIRKVYVVRRVTVEQITGKFIFYEVILNDKLSDVFFIQTEPTFLHGALKQLVANGGNPRDIRFWDETVTLMDEEVQKAWEAGTLDDFTYAYLYDKTQIRNEWIHVIHPLLKDPYNQIYKTTEFYPRDYIPSTQMTSQPRQSEQKFSMPQSVEEYSTASKRIFKFWFIGFITPLYSLVLLSFFRSGI
jgi:hypothetical protein